MLLHEKNRAKETGCTGLWLMYAATALHQNAHTILMVSSISHPCVICNPASVFSCSGHSKCFILVMLQASLPPKIPSLKQWNHLHFMALAFMFKTCQTWLPSNIVVMCRVPFLSCSLCTNPADLKEGLEVARYAGSTPPKGTGLHR
jgi:hypothetical protein